MVGGLGGGQAFQPPTMPDSIAAHVSSHLGFEELRAENTLAKDETSRDGDELRLPRPHCGEKTWREGGTSGDVTVDWKSTRA